LLTNGDMTKWCALSVSEFNQLIESTLTLVLHQHLYYKQELSFYVKPKQFKYVVINNHKKKTKQNTSSLQSDHSSSQQNGCGMEHKQKGEG
jgi:hypothetical protein